MKLVRIFVFFFLAAALLFSSAGPVSAVEKPRIQNMPGFQSVITANLSAAHQFLAISKSNPAPGKIGSQAKKPAAKAQKVAYITFDDGPNRYTSQILTILKNKKVKATFFAVEPNIKAYKTSMIRVNREGHYIGLHSVTHNATKVYKGSSINVAKEMETTRKTLNSVVKVNHYLVRVPYGSKPYMKKPFRDWLVKYKFKMWDWTIDTNDWRYKTSQYTSIINNVKTAVPKVEKQKKPIIILMHERPQTVKALPQIIDYLKGRGYTLVPYHPKQHVVSNFWGDGRL
ncbi:polysaccharide deacetylase family protein [Bacillus mangrovi]|uniref:Polysaccharide deacetylase family protein n=1 Tax=Metabacillus mangrovi TaxID=1491830 RepID=A0A7X2S7R4_9BACI|nr:polysaccharide deacetylase family protein [Metabacillus mangrovi]MTH54835.1 polysaccharide deacetylase family protein [Metabacillus mangrovi]